MILLAAIPISIIILLIRRAVLHHQLKTDKSDNATLYREIGRLNKQVLSLMDEKNSILALKVNAMGGTEKIPYMGASALTDDVLPTVKNVTGITGGAKAAASQAAAETAAKKVDHRFPKLSLVDQKYEHFQYPEYNNQITLEDFVEGYRLFAASQMNLY